MAPTALATIETDAIGTAEDEVCTGSTQAGRCIYCSGPETD